jgi:hypothetical protein
MSGMQWSEWNREEKRKVELEGREKRKGMRGRGGREKWMKRRNMNEKRKNHSKVIFLINMFRNIDLFLSVFSSLNSRLVGFIFTFFSFVSSNNTFRIINFLRLYWMGFLAYI